MCIMTTEVLRCPECNSENVIVMAAQWWYANTGELFCYHVKTHDRDSPAECLDCDWEGSRYQIIKSIP